MNDNNIELPKKINPEPPKESVTPPLETPAPVSNTNMFDQPANNTEIKTQEPNLDVNIFDMGQAEVQTPVNLVTEEPRVQDIPQVLPIGNINIENNVVNPNQEVSPFDSLTSPETPVIEQANIPDNTSNIFDVPTPKPEVQPLEPAPVINNTIANEQPIINQGQAFAPEPVVNMQAEPMTSQEPALTQEPVVPVNQDVGQTVTPSQDPIAQEPLNKKVLVEAPVKKDKSKGNMFVGFIAVLLILAIILAALFYFIKMDYIKVPDNIRNKIPGISQKVTKTPDAGIPPINENEDNNQNPNEDFSNINLPGEYQEAEFAVCPDVPSVLRLTEDLMFSYHKLNFDEAAQECIINELIGTYTSDNGKLILNTDNDEIISANYRHTGVTTEISIETEDGNIVLYDINE